MGGRVADAAETGGSDRENGMSASAGASVMLVAGPSRSARTDAWHLFAHEFVGHLRLSHDTVEALDVTSLPERGIVLLAEPPDVQAAQREALLEWVAAGNAAIIVGGPGDLAGDLGVACGRAVADGHVHLTPALTSSPGAQPLRAFGGVQLVPSDAWDVAAHWHGDERGAVAVARRTWGAGTVTVFGVDVWQSIVRILQGDPVHADGTPAPDGSSPVDDGILKCDDGLTLAYDLDRRQPAGAPPLPDAGYDYVFPVEQVAPMFDRPEADLWRDALLTCLVETLTEVGAPSAWVDYWPDGLPAVAHVSLDSDGNDSEHALEAIELLRRLDVRVTWCHQYPGGYRQEVLDAITRDGHEHALHYNAMGDADGAVWSEQAFQRQLAWLQGILGSQTVISNKNHFTRWEGWTDLFLWCEHAGIQADETRGGSKPGNAGFTFGTSHPWFPMATAAEHNRPIDVLALPLHTQDLSLVVHETIRDVILDGAVDQHGLAHFLFHPTHLATRAHVRDALSRLISELTARTLPVWTCAEVNEWQRARRDVDVAIVRHGEAGYDVRLVAATDAAGAVTCLLLPADGDAAYTCHREDGTAVTTSWVTRHGHRFLGLSMAMRAGTTLLRVRRVEDGQATSGMAGRQATTARTESSA